MIKAVKGHHSRHKSKLFEAEYTQLKPKDINEAFIQNSPTFCVAIYPDGRTALMNDAMLKALGYTADEVLGKPYLSTFVPERDRKLLSEVFKSHIEHHAGTINENFVLTKDGRKVLVEWHSRPVITEHGKYVYHLGVGIDRTERKKVEEALRISQKNYRTLVESSLTPIYVEQDENIVLVNKRFLENFGYSKEELNSLNISSLIYPADKVRFETIRNQKKRDALIEYEIRGVAKDGTVRWFIWKNALIQYKGKPAILGNIVDITNRREMENALRESERNLRFLSSQLLAVQEKERNRISRELHDELGQALSVLKLDTGSIMKRLSANQSGLRKDCEKLRNCIDDVIANVRRLSRDLSPVILEDLGFLVALREMIKSVAKHYRVECSIKSLEIDYLFSQEVKIAIYRIFQELFNNIIKHAHASCILVIIEIEDHDFRSVVEDDGIGFNARDEWTKNSSERGLGLAIMNERVKMLGGRFEVASEAGKGTRVTFTIPTKSGVIDNG